MKLLLYAPRINQTSRRVHQAAASVVSPERTEIYPSLEALVWGLHRPLNRPAVAVLVASDQEELARLVGLAPLLDDIRTILVLPDNQSSTLETAHKLRPRFCLYQDSDMAHLAAVLDKLFSAEKVKETA